MRRSVTRTSTSPPVTCSSAARLEPNAVAATPRSVEPVGERLGHRELVVDDDHARHRARRHAAARLQRDPDARARARAARAARGRASRGGSSRSRSRSRARARCLPGRLGREERLGRARRVLRRDALALVGDDERDLAASARDVDAHRAAARGDASHALSSRLTSACLNSSGSHRISGSRLATSGSSATSARANRCWTSAAASLTEHLRRSTDCSAIGAPRASPSRPRTT